MPKSRKFWKRVAVVLVSLVVLLLLFVVAFIFNPLEGSLRDVRDVIPREVDFFLRKKGLSDDFSGGDGQLRLVSGEIPEPAFWADMTDTLSWSRLESGPLVGGLDRDYRDVLRNAVDGLVEVEASTGGLLDLSRDLIGSEVVIAGYFEDRTNRGAPRPLAEPWWCLYARVSWRLRAAWGLLRWQMVQDQMRGQGVDIQSEGELLVIKASGQTIYAARRLDCLMVANSQDLIEQSLRLVDGSEQEEPFGQAAKYTDGIVLPRQRWEENNRLEGEANTLEFSLSANALDPFRRFAASWPDAANQDSMNERVLASFLNLKGWNSVSGALLFQDRALSMLGEVVLNSNLHTPFQRSFYQAEQQARDAWLDPFLRMVPDSACAAAALRMRVGDFLDAMYGALLQEEKDLLNDAFRRCVFRDQALEGTRDLISRVKLAFQPRSGFVFRRNVPDTSLNRDGELAVPVTAKSPVPQVAWVFWLRPGTAPLVKSLVNMLKKNTRVFRFVHMYHLAIDDIGEEVTEFTNPQIPGTGEIATVVFPGSGNRQGFFVLSNSGPLIKDIVRTRFVRKGTRSVFATDDYASIERELASKANGFIWLRGRNLLPVFDDYRQASEAQNLLPDPVWMQQSRPAAEAVVLREQFKRYRSLAAMPSSIRNGEFAEAVTAYLKEQWGQAGTGLSSGDIPAIEQMQSFIELVDTAFLEVELESNHIRFLGKILTTW